MRRYSAASLEKARFELPRLIHHLGENGVRDATRGQRGAPRRLRAASRATDDPREGRRSRPRAARRRSAPCGASSPSSRAEGIVLRDPAAGDPAAAEHARCRAGSSARARRGASSRRPSPGSAIGKRDRAILELLYGTGIRLGEAARADVSDLDLREGVLLVRSGKGKKDRVVPGAGPCRDRPRHLPRRGAPRAREARGRGALPLARTAAG